MFFYLVFLLFPSEDVFMEIQVRERVINVFVLEGGKHPVQGLSTEDFQIFEGGQLQEISYFEAYDYRTEKYTTIPDQQTEKGLPIQEPAKKQHIIIFIDSGFLTKSSFDELIKNLIAFVEESDLQNSRIKLIHLDQSLKQLTPFTDSKELLIQALNETVYHGVMRKIFKQLNHAILGTQDRSIRGPGSGSAIISRPGRNPEVLKGRLRHKGEIVQDYYRTALECLIGSAYILKSYSGPKSIYSFSGGGYRANNTDLGDPALEELTAYFTQLLNGSGTTLHNFLSDDGRPVPFEGGIDALNETSWHGDMPSRRKGRGHFLQPAPLSKTVSIGTGGFSRLIKGKNVFLDAVRDVHKLSQTGYTLSYTLDEKCEPGKVTIKLKNKKYNWRLLYGKEYLIPTPEHTLRGGQKIMALEGTLFFGRQSDDISLTWYEQVLKIDQENYLVSIICQLTDLSELGTHFEVAAAALNENDEPLGYVVWDLQSDLLKDRNDFSLLLQTSEPPNRIHLLIRDPIYGAHYLGRQTCDHNPVSQLSPVFLLTDKDSLLMLNRSVPPAIDQTHLTNDPFVFNSLPLNPLTTLNSDSELLSLFHIYDYQTLGPSFTVDLEAASGEKIQTEIIQIRKINPRTLSVLCRHQTESIMHGEKLILRIKGESQQALEAHLAPDSWLGH